MFNYFYGIKETEQSHFGIMKMMKYQKNNELIFKMFTRAKLTSLR